MHIKQILIQNFKSYKYEVITELNKSINVILGKNGQGKSNLLNGMTYICFYNSESTQQLLLY